MLSAIKLKIGKVRILIRIFFYCPGLREVSRVNSPLTNKYIDLGTSVRRYARNKKKASFEEKLYDSIMDAISDSHTRQQQIIHELDSSKEMLFSITKALDCLANSMGASNQRTTKENMQTQELVKKLNELIASNDGNGDDKVIKFLRELKSGVAITIVSDLIKKVIGIA